MRKAKGNIRKMLAAIVLTLLCCSAFAQRIVESGDLRTTIGRTAWNSRPLSEGRKTSAIGQIPYLAGAG